MQRDLLLGVDTRSVQEAAGGKLEWLRRHEPDVFARTRHFFTSNSHLAFRLTGEHVLDQRSASQTTPLSDRPEAAWIGDRCEEVAEGLPMPRLVRPSERIGTVTAAASAATGIRLGTPVATGTCDAWAEAESVDVGRPGDLTVVYGSTTFFIAVTGLRWELPAERAGAAPVTRSSPRSPSAPSTWTPPGTASNRSPDRMPWPPRSTPSCARPTAVCTR